MAKDAVPTLQSLEKPEDLNKLLKEDAGDDCLPCRLVGTPPLEAHCTLAKRQEKR